MKQEVCRSCLNLGVIYGEWICTLTDLPCEDIEYCPEGLEEGEEHYE